MSKLYIFDFDGTLQDSRAIYAEAVRRIYREMEEAGVACLMPESELTDSRIAGWLGMSIPDMWQEFCPAISAIEQKHYAARIGEEMHAQVREGKASLYPGVRAKLDQLKGEGATLVILSNGTKADAQLYWQQFGLGDYFQRWYDGQSFDWAPKSRMILQLARDYPAEEYAVVGDRSSDWEAAIALYEAVAEPKTGRASKKVAFLRCRYGYGARDFFRPYEGEGFLQGDFIL